MEINDFVNELKKINIEINEEQLKQLEKYYQLLVEWNKNINLTAITEKELVYLKHFYDSITLVKAIDLNTIQNMCDVGTGAGFPGIVIKILFPEISVTLVDSLNKRINFLNQVIEKLNLKKIVAIHARVEDYGRLYREKYDLVVARAVAPLNVLVEYCVPLVQVNKYFISMKGNINNEIELSRNAFTSLNCILEKIIQFNLPKENSNRSLIVIKKLKKTNLKYPRKIKEIREKNL